DGRVGDPGLALGTAAYRRRAAEDRMKALAILVGSVLAVAVLLGIVIGLPISMLPVAVLSFTLLGRRDWVPVIYNVRSLGVRKWTTAVTAGGLTLVVVVVATV